MAENVIVKELNIRGTLDLNKIIQFVCKEFKSTWNKVDGNKIIFALKNIVYIALWTIVSLVSSFNQIIPSIKKIWGGDYSLIFEGDFYTKTIAPLLIWTIAFFVDYLYQLWTIGAKEDLNKFWVKLSNFAVFAIFVVLVYSIFYHEDIMQKTISVVGLLACMIALKTSALYVVAPSFKVEKR